MSLERIVDDVKGNDVYFALGDSMCAYLVCNQPAKVTLLGEVKRAEWSSDEPVPFSAMLKVNDAMVFETVLNCYGLMVPTGVPYTKNADNGKPGNIRVQLNDHMIDMYTQTV